MRERETKTSSLWGGAGLVAFPDNMVALLLLNVRKRMASFLTALSSCQRHVCV